MFPYVGLQHRVKVLKFPVGDEANYEDLSGTRDTLISRENAKRKWGREEVSLNTLRVEGGAGGRWDAGGGWKENKKKKTGKLNKIAFEQKSHFLSILERRPNLGQLTTQFPAALRGNSWGGGGVGGCCDLG